jgi:superfamily II DNA or RNA helicase
VDNPQIEAFFREGSPNVYGNVALREPQIEAYQAIVEHVQVSHEPCYIQLPVGCGKTGLMGMTPFGAAKGRVLIVVPNLTLRANALKELDISNPENFYAKRGVLAPPWTGPYLSELRTGANRHDCDDAHIVVANVQQFSGETNRWYEQFPRDYFQMILVDEGHHNVAPSWTRLFEHFEEARVISYTATPLRADGQRVVGVKAYSFGYARSMMLGYISPVDAIHVAPSRITFTAKGKAYDLTLEEIMEMRERDWFSKGIALSETCNRSIVQASMERLQAVRQLGAPRQIIAVTCSIRHASQVAALYQEYGLTAEVLSSKLDKDERDRIDAALRTGSLDVVVQVQMLGEGYDLRTLSVAAVFRPYRNLSPYIQFVGRILRLALPDSPGSPANRVYVVSHVGLNDERWWQDFTNFDRDDQQFFAEYLGGEAVELEGTDVRPRMTLRSFMRVLNETVDKYIQRGFLTEVDATMVTEVLNAIRSRGFDPLEFGLTEEIMRRRLELAVRSEREIPIQALPVQPQRRREALRRRVYQEARSIADTVANRLGVPHNGRDLLRHFPGRGPSNIVVLINLAQGEQNRAMGIEAGQRDEASATQLDRALAASADIVDKLTFAVRMEMRG